MIFSIVIPTRDRRPELAQCLHRLAPGAQTLPAADYETIVTDDSPTESARAVVQTYPAVRYIVGTKRGPAANRNCGAAQARGDWLVFVDDDCLPDPGWLQGYARRIQQADAPRVCEGRTYAGGERRSCYETSPVNEQGGHLWSCNFAIERAVFAALGGFDERFPYAAMEDVDLRVRLERTGQPVAFEPAAAVRHPWRVESDLRRARRRHRESVLVFNRLHPDRAVLRGERVHLLKRRLGREFWQDLRRFGWEAVRYHAVAAFCDLADIRAYPARRAVADDK